MICPCEKKGETSVVDSRPTEDGTAIRRRRLCTVCGERFTTFERIQIRELFIVKKNGTIFLGGPHLVKAATGEVSNPQELGGAELHTSLSGVADYFAEDEYRAWRTAFRECTKLQSRCIPGQIDIETQLPLIVLMSR